MPPFFTARGCSPNSAIARAADNLGYHRGSCGCSRSNRTVYSSRISIPTRRRRILDRHCHLGRRHTTRHNRTHGGNRNLGGVVRCLRGIHGACSCFLSFGDELHLARLWRCGDVGFLEIARATRSGHGRDVGPLQPGRIIDFDERTMRYFDPTLQLGLIHQVKVTPLHGHNWIPGPIAQR